jgi:hypothetical protein
MNRRSDSRLSNALQRMLALLIFAVIAAMVWLAHTGRYDHQVDQLASWLHRHYDALLR